MRIVNDQSFFATGTRESAFVPKYFTPWNFTYADCKYTVPYQIDGKIAKTHRGYSELKLAFDKLESNSSLKFMEQTDQERYLYFTDGFGCRSYVGQQKKRGPQNITLGRGCLFYYTIIHEVRALESKTWTRGKRHGIIKEKHWY